MITDITVMSLEEVLRHVPTDPTIVVSIGNSHEEEKVPFKHALLFTDILPLKFEDCTEDWENDRGECVARPITPVQAIAILRFVKNWDTQDKQVKMIVHCAAGLSRSPGVACALNQIFMIPVNKPRGTFMIKPRSDDPQDWFAHHNRKVFSVILNTAHRLDMI